MSKPKPAWPGKTPPERPALFAVTTLVLSLHHPCATTPSASHAPARSRQRNFGPCKAVSPPLSHQPPHKRHHPSTYATPAPPPKHHRHSCLQPLPAGRPLPASHPPSRRSTLRHSACACRHPMRPQPRHYAAVAAPAPPSPNGCCRCCCLRHRSCSLRTRAMPFAEHWLVASTRMSAICTCSGLVGGKGGVAWRRAGRCR